MKNNPKNKYIKKTKLNYMYMILITYLPLTTPNNSYHIVQNLEKIRN